MLGDHADAIALPQAADKFLFKPGKLEGGALDVEDLGHVSPDHPADVNAKLRLMVDRHTASFRVGLQVGLSNRARHTDCRKRVRKISDAALHAKASASAC